MARIDIERFVPNTILMTLCFACATQFLLRTLRGEIILAQYTDLEVAVLGMGFFALVAYGFFCLSEMWASLPDEPDEIKESINATGE